jgi:hypothetical protein
VAFDPKMNKAIVELGTSDSPSLGRRSKSLDRLEALFEIKTPADEIPTTPDRTAIVQELEAMVQFRLFGRNLWFANQETLCSLTRRIAQMGLEEPGRRTTTLGKELNVDL